MSARLVILASGNGTNAQALIDACAHGTLAAEIVGVISNRNDAGVLDRAERAGVSTRVVEHRGVTSDERRHADAALGSVIDGFDPDLVVLAGWMRILGDDLCGRFPFINLHPALPGELPGVGAIERAFDEFQRGERAGSGVMVHWVPDSGVDVGPVIVSAPVEMLAGDDLESFALRMHRVEHELIVHGVAAALAEFA